MSWKPIRKCGAEHFRYDRTDSRRHDVVKGNQSAKERKKKKMKKKKKTKKNKNKKRRRMKRKRERHRNKNGIIKKAER